MFHRVPFKPPKESSQIRCCAEAASHTWRTGFRDRTARSLAPLKISGSWRGMADWPLRCYIFHLRPAKSANKRGFSKPWMSSKMQIFDQTSLQDFMVGRAKKIPTMSQMCGQVWFNQYCRIPFGAFLVPSWSSWSFWHETTNAEKKTFQTKWKIIHHYPSLSIIFHLTKQSCSRNFQTATVGGKKSP